MVANPVERQWLIPAESGTVGPDGIQRWALFGPGRVHRYALWRAWRPVERAVVFVLLNPSIADERVDDPTIRRCITYAKDWGFDMACILNIFAFRSTDPKALRTAEDPVGPDNDAWIRSATTYERIVLAWGSHGTYRDRGAQVRQLLIGAKNMHTFGLTANGQPKHPLYLRKSAALLSAS